MFEDFGGRRFLLTLGCGGVTTALLIGGYVDQVIFRDIIIATVAAYITGNVIQKIKAHSDDTTDSNPKN